MMRVLAQAHHEREGDAPSLGNWGREGGQILIQVDVYVSDIEIVHAGTSKIWGPAFASGMVS